MFISLAINQQISLCMHTSTRGGAEGRRKKGGRKEEERRKKNFGRQGRPAKAFRGKFAIKGQGT